MMTCLIVDDQIEAIRLLEDHINLIPYLRLEFATNEAINAINYFNENSVDLVFLDIQMPGLSGLEFIEALKEKCRNEMPKVILTTGYDSFAIKGFEYGVFDYLLKPISFKRFQMSVDRLYNEQKKQRIEEPLVKFIFVEVDGKKLKVNFSDVLYIEAAGNYLFIITNTTKITVYKSLSSILDNLPKSTFVRIHKSFIINIENIHSIRSNEVMIKVQEVLKSLPMGDTYKDSVFHLLHL
jgi:two-component system, LytTR family, response regulator